MRKSLSLFAAALLATAASAAAHADILYITDSANGTIDRYVTGTTGVWTPGLVGGLNTPIGVALSDSTLFVASYGNGMGDGVIGTYTTDGNVVNPALITGLSGAYGIAIAESKLYVSNYDAGTIGVYTTDGVPINPALITGLSWPTALAVSGSNLYVGNDNTGAVSLYNTSGVLVNPDLGAGGVTGLAVSGDALYVVDWSGAVSRVTMSGGAVTSNVQIGGGPFSAPGGVAVADPTIYVVSSYPAVIGEFTTNGTQVKSTVISYVSKPGDSSSPPWCLGIAAVASIPRPQPPPNYPPVDYLPPGAPLLKSFMLQLDERPLDSGKEAMMGWSFHLAQTTTIWQVGWFDQGLDGLSYDCQVGLWYEPVTGATVQLLGMPDSGIVIPQGTTRRLIGSWRVVDLPEPLELEPGDYVLGGLVPNGATDGVYFSWNWEGNPFADEPALALSIGHAFDTALNPENPSASALEPKGFHEPLPGSFFAEPSYMLGPMLFFAVPEPSSLLLLLMAAAFLARRHCTSSASPAKCRHA